MTISLGVGTRLPAHCTSMGRVLLADLAPDELDAYLAHTTFEAHTERTITDPDRLRHEIETVRAQGWVLVDQELELGLRSIAAPLRAGGRTIAALNVAVAAPRVSLDELRGAILPELLSAAERISAALARTHDDPARAAALPGSLVS